MKEPVKRQFVHLKIHTQYSICEGALRTSELAAYCKTNQIKAVALCDSLIYVEHSSFQKL